MIRNLHCVQFRWSTLQSGVNPWESVHIQLFLRKGYKGAVVVGRAQRRISRECLADSRNVAQITARALPIGYDEIILMVHREEDVYAAPTLVLICPGSCSH
jgi:hypothetical protein